MHKSKETKEYTYSKKCREISGFGGSYEDACRNMVIAGMKWLDKNVDAKIDFKQYKNVYGMTFDKSKDCKKMQDAMLKVVGGDCTGEMMQACMNHIMFAHTKGWDNYIKELNSKK